MGHSSQSGQVGFGIQSLKGTPVAATCFARLRGGSLGGDRELLIPDPEIGGNRDIPQAYMGPIAFSGSLDFYPRMRMLAMLLKGAFGASSSSTTAGTSEVQTVTITGTPTGGTFTLQFRGQTTSAIAYNAAAAAVDTALEALSTVGAGNVVVGGGPGPGTPYTVTFGGALATTNPPPIIAAGAFTGGTNPAIAVTTTTPGFPIMGVHTITPTDALPWLSVEERVGASLESFRYTDAKVSKLRLECDASGYFMGSADLIGLTQVADFSAQATPAIDVTPLMVGSTITVNWNGVALPAKSMFFEVDNGIEDDDFRLGSVFLGDAVEKRRTMKMGVTIRPNDSDLWKAATYGTDSSGTTAQAGAAVQGVAQIIAQSYENIQGASTPFRLILDVPSAVMAPFKYNPSGDDVIEHDIEITLIRPDPVVPIVTATVRNDLATVV